MGDQIAFSSVSVKHDRRRHSFAIDSVGNSKAHRLSHCRMSEQRLINLARRNLLPTAIDQFFEAANERQITIRIQIALVARAEPGLSGCGWLFGARWPPQRIDQSRWGEDFAARD